jgi:hypothetical protein
MTIHVLKLTRTYMEKIIIVFAMALFAPQITQAQGTIYMSNLGLPSAGSVAVGSDSWLGVAFRTGTNASGYTLNSIQLRMADASGNPSGFTALLYGNGNIPAGNSLGSSLGVLIGSTDPAIGGIFTYAPPSNLTLLPHTFYSIVLTAGTAVANGAYEWSYAGTYSYNLNDGWDAGGGLWTSSNGSSWNSPTLGDLQYAINATVVPEPGVLSLLGLGGLLLALRRWKAWI